MVRYLLGLVFFFGMPGIILAQDMPPIQLDRPDQTESPSTVPAGYVQVEAGLLYETYNPTTTIAVYPTILWKYGINEIFELRLITEHATQKESGRKTSGILPVTVGFKTNLLQEKGIIPLTSFLGHLTLPHTGRKEFHTSYAAPAFRFAMQHTLSANITLAYNLGAEWDGESPAETYIYSLTNGVSISKTLGIYGEFYGYFPTQEKANHFFDCGVTYLINNNCIADFSGGLRLTGNELKNYIALGFSFRADTRGNKR